VVFPIYILSSRLFQSIPHTCFLFLQRNFRVEETISGQVRRILEESFYWRQIKPLMNVHEETSKMVKYYIKRGLYVNAILRAFDLAFGLYEHDEEMLREIACTLWTLSDYLGTCVDKRSRKESQFYMEVYRNLFKYREELPQQKKRMRTWKQHSNQDKLMNVEAHNFSKELIDKVAIDPNSQEALIQSLKDNFKLKFVPKGTVVYKEHTLLESVHFVALGSVGLWSCLRDSTGRLPYTIKRRGSVSFFSVHIACSLVSVFSRP